MMRFFVYDCDLFTCDFMELFTWCDGCGCNLLCIYIYIYWNHTSQSHGMDMEHIHVQHRTQKCITPRANRTM